MKTTLQSLVYSVSATRRILGLDDGKPVRIRVWQHVVWVHVSGQKPVLLSKSIYNNHFAEYRQRAARSMIVSRKLSTLYTVTNPKSGHIYQVRLDSKRTVCGCEDFKQQTRILNKACCKHVYAVLDYLGRQPF